MYFIDFINIILPRQAHKFKTLEVF